MNAAKQEMLLGLCQDTCLVSYMLKHLKLQIFYVITFLKIYIPYLYDYELDE